MCTANNAAAARAFAIQVRRIVCRLARSRSPNCPLRRQGLGVVWLIAFLIFSRLQMGFAAGPEAAGTSDHIALWEASHYGMYIHHQLVKTYRDGQPEALGAVEASVERWVRAAKEAGMAFVVLVAKHEDGFCLWDSQDYDEDIGSAPVKTDPLKALVDACGKEKLLPGVHYSIGDRYSESGDILNAAVSRLYFDLVLRHTRELYSAYPQIGFLLFDLAHRLSPAQRRQLYDEVHRLNPRSIVLLGGYRQLVTRSQIHLGPDPGLETDAYVPRLAISSVLGKDWGWSAAARCAPVEDLHAVYRAAREKQANLLLNIAPDRTGAIPPAQLQVLSRLRALLSESDTAAAAPAGRRPVQERLVELKQLLQQGLIDQATYDKRLKEIMESL